MKKASRWLVLLALVIALLLSCVASADQKESDAADAGIAEEVPAQAGVVQPQEGQDGAVQTSVPGLFNAMEKRFEEADYDTAYELALQIEMLGGQNYSSASLYIGYLKGWKAMQQDDIDSAISYFSPITAAKFKNAEGYFAYLMGRKEQENGNYAQAIAYYQQASALEVYNGVSYQSECEMQLQAEAYAAAERYEQQGNYLLAAQAFEQLNVYKDSNERRKACYYAYAGQLVDNLQYAEAAEVYNALGTYQNSVELATKYYAIAQSDLTSSAFVDIVITQVDPRTLLVTWSDTLQLGSYNVSWYPGSMEKAAQTQTVQACSAVLENLYPSTTYQIVITSDKNEAARAETSGMTAQSQPQTVMRLFTQEVLTYEQQELLTTPLTQLQGAGKTHPIENNAIQLPSRSMSESGKGYMLSCSVDRPITQEDEQYSYLCVVRIGDCAAASSGQFTVQGFWQYPSFCLELTSLFDKIYAENSAWPDTTADIDLYINDSLLSQTTVSLISIQ